MERVQRVREAWELLSGGDLTAMGDLFTVGARWLAVEDGPWNCESRAAILDAMAFNHAHGRDAGSLEDVVAVGDRVIVAFRPERPGPGGWPLDGGVRCLVLSFEGDRISEMKGCADRAQARAYAEGPSEPS